jgi:hypothetical protein
LAGRRLSAEELILELERLQEEMRRQYLEAAQVVERAHPTHRQSAGNLIDYLTMRHYDLRDIQESLAELGLSSLGRSEEHVITTLERVIDNLHLLSGDGARRRTDRAARYSRPMPRRCSGPVERSAPPGSSSPCRGKPPTTTSSWLISS